MKSKVFVQTIKKIIIKHRWFSCAFSPSTKTMVRLPGAKRKRRKNFLEKRHFMFFQFFIEKEENFSKNWIQRFDEKLG